MSKYGVYLNQKRLTKEEYYEYKKHNKKYTDELYPPNDTSIYSQTLKGEFHNKKSGQKLKDSLDSLLIKDSKKLTIEWERISDRPYYNTIYNDKISHEQIEQGSLGDCYLISLLASISHFPELIIGKKDKDTPHILYNYEYGDIGYYEIMFFIDGEYKIVIIDDYIPFVKEKGIIIFANSSENYYWVNLVEKAYSKICGGYTSMDLISMEENKNKENYDHFQVMTGFKYKKYPFYEEKDGQFILNMAKAKEIQKIIEDNLGANNEKKFNTMITTGTPDENKGLYLEENYIPYQHSFSILDFKKIKINNNKNEIKLLLMNNPWGRNIYNGGIGPYCLENLNENTINLKPYIEYNLNSEDGCFWIDFDSFLKNYISITICKIPCNYYCTNYELNSAENYELPLMYKVKIEKKANIWFNVNMNLSEQIIKGNDSIYLMKFLIINKIDDNGKIVKTYNDISGLDDLQTDYNLDVGNYIVWLYIPKRYFPESNKLNAHFMLSFDKKVNFEFIGYDTDFKYIKNLSQISFEQNNQQKIKEQEDKMIKCVVDCKSVDGILIVYLANNTQDKKIKCEPVSDCSGFSPLNYKEEINFNKISVTLLPGESIYYFGLSTSKKSVFSINKIDMTYSETQEKKSNVKSKDFKEYLSKQLGETNKKIKSVKYKTNSYCYIHTNFNKNPDKRDEDNIFKYFLDLMTVKLKPKKLSEEKIKLITQNAWNKMSKEEKEKLSKKYEKKKKELKNNVLKMQVLKYIKRNTITNNNTNLNSMDNDIINMKMKTRLSHEFQFAKFEDDLDELEIKIKNILPKIEYLKKTEKDEIKLDNYIDKQNKISTEFKKLLSEKLTVKTGQQIEKKKIELLQEYEPYAKKMFEYFKTHEKNMKLYNEITSEGKILLNEVQEQVEIYNTKKLNMKKELNDIIDKFMNLMEEIKKLKLVQINEKCNREVKKAMEFSEDVKKMQNKLTSFVDELKDNIKNKQNELLPQNKFEETNTKLNELNDTLNKLKNAEKDYNYLLELINEENTYIKNCENINNTMTKDNIKDIIAKLETYEKQIQDLSDKINNFQGDVKKIVDIFNGFIKDLNIIRKDIGEIFNKFKENNLPLSDNIKTISNKIKELDEGFNKLKVKEILDKNKNILMVNWNKVNDAFSSSLNKIRSLKGIKVNNEANKDNINEGNKLNNEQIKEIKDKVNKDLTKLEKEQSDIKNKVDKIKNDKIKLVEDINNISKEAENALVNIRSVFNNDIKNITKQNVQGNFEKYSKFNEKYKDIGKTTNEISTRCKSLFESYNSLINVEETNRKTIYNNINILQDNRIGIDENTKNIIKKAKEIFDIIENLKLNELNSLFNNNAVAKFKEMSAIIKALSSLNSK